MAGRKTAAAKAASNGAPRALLVRRTDQGTRLQQVPDEHVFSSRWIARELAAGLVKVTITLTPDQGDPHTFELEGFEEIRDDKGDPVTDSDGNVRLNFTGWRARKGG